MKKVLAAVIAVCGLLCLTGCGEELDQAAYNAQKKITDIGNAGNKPGNGLNQIVDDFFNQSFSG